MQNQDREFKEVRTVSGHSVKIKTYLTGREANDLKKIAYEKVNYNNEDAGAAGNVNISGSFLLEQELKGLEICVISIDEKNDAILETLQDFPYNEYQEVVKAVNEVTKDVFTSVKSK